MQSARVWIADDQPIFRRGIALSLGMAKGVESVIELCPTSLLNRVETSGDVQADILIYGHTSHGLTSLMIPWVLLRQQPHIRVVVVGQMPDDSNLLNGLTLGISAFISRRASISDIVKTVERIAEGAHPIFDEVLKRHDLAVQVLNLFRTMVPTDEVIMEPKASPARLSSREIEILGYAAVGYSNKQIGDVLALSDKTIRNQMSTMFKKLGARNRVEAVHAAIEQGTIPQGIVQPSPIEVLEMPTTPRARREPCTRVAHANRMAWAGRSHLHGSA